MAITTKEFEKFRDFYYRKTGTYFADNKRYFVDKRIDDQIHRHQFKDFNDYFTYLRFDIKAQTLMQDLINSMTVNETYFMRESYQFDCLVNSLLPELVKRRPGQLLRVLSLPCSTGEEPYSIAMTILERWPQINEVDVELVATDIDSNVLEKARRGVFGRRSISRVPMDWQRKYFTKLTTNIEQWELSHDITGAVSFYSVNLIDEHDVSKLGKFDVIFCRNLLIYFDTPSRMKAAKHFYKILNPGGYLLLGHSESMSRISSLFKPVRFAEGTVYQK